MSLDLAEVCDADAADMVRLGTLTTTLAGEHRTAEADTVRERRANIWLFCEVENNGRGKSIVNDQVDRVSPTSALYIHNSQTSPQLIM